MKRKFSYILLASVLLTGLTFCEKDILLPENLKVTGDASSPKKDSVPLNPNLNLTYDSVKDIDGNVYKTIKIGSQLWMAENLKTTRYNDGSRIYQGYGAPAGYTDWFDLRVGAYVWWDNGESSSWGALYNWLAVSGFLCPAGWHVPTNLEWKTLISYLGGEKSAPGKLLQSGTNESGFNAIITGDLCGWGFCPGSCIFWTATDFGSSFPYGYCVSFCVNGVIIDCSEPQSYGFNVRCMKDN